jgi:hypothetical protein
VEKKLSGVENGNLKYQTGILRLLQLQLGECETNISFTHFPFSLFARITFEQSRIAESENVRFFFSLVKTTICIVSKPLRGLDLNSSRLEMGELASAMQGSAGTNFLVFHTAAAGRADICITARTIGKHCNNSEEQNSEKETFIPCFYHGDFFFFNQKLHEEVRFFLAELRIRIRIRRIDMFWASRIRIHWSEI